MTRRTGGGSGDYLRVNREQWERQSASYDRRFRRVLGGTRAEAWGLWRVPERRLGLLPEVRARATLEVGCGAARWSIALAQRGAHAVGLDLSRAQLAHARREVAAAGVSLPLVRGSVERLPFEAGSFHLVFCDWGALTFADPRLAIPECARVLRAGGHLVFATASPVQLLARDFGRDRLTRHLLRPYFDLHRIDYPNEVNFQLPYGEWLALFRRCGLAVERLVETRPTPRARSAYLSRRDERWARSWPMECIWRARREPDRLTPRAPGQAPDAAGRRPAARRASGRGRARSPRSRRPR